MTRRDIMEKRMHLHTLTSHTGSDAHKKEEAPYYNASLHVRGCYIAIVQQPAVADGPPPHVARQGISSVSNSPFSEFHR